MGGEKVYTLILKVNLSCCRCRQVIDKHLCCHWKEKITKIDYDVANDKVKVSGLFDAEKLKSDLLGKFSPKIIKDIEVEAPKVEKPKDELKEKFMKKCEEEYAEIKICIEKCKKECEEKCMEKFRCKCKNECKDKCICDCRCKCKEKCSCHCKEKEKPKEKKPKEEKPKEEKPKEEKPKEDPKPSQFFAICCARPCICFVPWSNNYQCCSCGVLSRPGWCGPGWGTGPSRPQTWVCEPSPPNIVFESSPCSIM